MLPWMDSSSTTSDILDSLHLEKTFFGSDFEASSQYPVICPECCEKNQKSGLRFMFVNEEEAVFKCESSDCLYPFREFIFKNITDNTVYRYQPSLTRDSERHFVPPAPDFSNIDSLMDEISYLTDDSDASQDIANFDLDSVLSEESTDNCIEELTDLKLWLDDVKEEKPTSATPKKLQKSLNFIKKGLIKQEIEGKPIKTDYTITPVDYAKTIQANKTEWGREETSKWASRQKIQKSKTVKQEKAPICVEEIVDCKPEPNVRRSSRIRNQKLQTVVTKKGIKKQSR
ncbi:SUMO-specific isopeptidase USPL1-like [Phlebotomus argentipes]|uniref:SUMO-specific isopeptidase USPL1-like n=1 Tax=Phlebotomus argentipes TaxID=94469 RepID=UPI0028934C6F|nr:SUMO-specific isopeptidase USPL1-like [Phlebotomus argentipes]